MNTVKRISVLNQVLKTLQSFLDTYVTGFRHVLKISEHFGYFLNLTVLQIADKTTDR